MKLIDLGITEGQLKSLEKKKVVSVEALLRRPPLHYYDFTKTYPLDLKDPEVLLMLEKNRPFAVSGECISIKTGSVDRARTINILITDEKTGNTLFVNAIGGNQFKESFLNLSKESPHRTEISIPENLPVYYSGKKREINESCRKQIIFINSLDERSPRDYIEIRTGGQDEWSKAKSEEIASDDIRKFVSTYLPHPGHMVNALRWYARGMRLDLAIKKILLEDDALLKKLILNKKFLVGGFIKYDETYKSFLLLKPTLFCPFEDRPKSYYVQYGQVKGITPDRYRTLIKKGVQEISSFDFLPSDVCRTLNLPSFKESARMMHFPTSYREVKISEERATNEDLLYLALKLTDRNKNKVGSGGITMNDYSLMKRYSSSLPYELTGDQKRAVNLVAKHMQKGEKAEALIQGDVGTGKTAVAICLMLIAVGSGYQAALAAPYTALASQHYRDIKSVADNLGIKAVVLTSDVKGKQKKEALSMIASGEASIIIGTHSIFTKDVSYKNLGLIIEDEEHKFGVIHRENFADKALDGAHHITMSATPIPKSIASTIYDDSMEIITILEKPSGRIPVQTATCTKDITAMEFMAKEIKNGHQCYVVCPSIEKKDGDDEEPVSIEEKSKIYKEYFNSLGYRMEIVTGKTKTSDRQTIMEEFASGKVNVLMATTVIEVGINNPNATVMTIIGADRFGFSTLHQLRGRVGRGAEKSYCILLTNKGNDKLRFMCETTDGFKIAEKDLEMRGPGSLFGERQSGDNYYINLMLSNPATYDKLKPIAKALCKNQTGKEIIRRYEEIFRSEEER